MGDTLFINIEEAHRPRLSSHDQVDVDLSYYVTGGEQPSFLEFAFPLRCSLSIPKDTEEEDIEWYFEKYKEEPLNSMRAQRARSNLKQQSGILFRELSIDDENISALGFSKVILEVVDGPDVSKLRWEALESPELWQSDVQFNVFRVSTAGQGKLHLQRTPTQKETVEQTNILIVVARKKDDSIDPRLTTGPLIRKLHQAGIDSVSVDIARPGTKEAFLQYLHRKDYDMVQLDLHGAVQNGKAVLFFQDPPKQGNTRLERTIGVGADEIGQALAVNRVKLVVMNACQSASTSRGLGANFASQLGNHGIPYVLGMAYKVTKTAVTIFMESLYENLIWRAMTVTCAIRQARAALRSDRTRNSELFGLNVTLDDDVLPVIYVSGPQLHRHSLALERTPRDPPAPPRVEVGRELLGRESDMLTLETLLFMDRCVVIYGPVGVGKRAMLNDLSNWLEETKIVQRIFQLSCSPAVSTIGSAIAIICAQIVPPSQTRESIESHPDTTEDCLLRYLSEHICILVVSNLETELPWMADLLAMFIGPKDTTDENKTPSFVLVSSTTQLTSLRKKVHEKTGRECRTRRLGELPSPSASAFARQIRGDKSTISLIGRDSYSALWYDQCILKTLGRNPLAIETVLSAEIGYRPSELYWALQTARLKLVWDNPSVKELSDRWKNIFQSHNTFLIALIPFTHSVPKGYLDYVLPSEGDQFTRNLQAVTLSLEEAGKLVLGDERQLPATFLHPLFSQFVRNQPMSVECWNSSWRSAAAYYHNRSIDWIRSQVVVLEELISEWENLMAVLHHLLGHIDTDDEESYMFDVPWIVCSFNAFNSKLPTHAVNMFADLTLSALQRIVPEFVATNNEAIQNLVMAGLMVRRSRLTDLQLIRVTIFCQFLIEYYYETSPETAVLYEHALKTLLESIENIEDGGNNDGFAALFRIAKSISCLAEIELAIEEERFVDTSLQPWSDIAAGMELPDAFRTFADMWGRSHAFRGIGLSIDLLETQRALPSIALSSVPGMQDPPGRQALNNAVEAFRALNGSSVAERVQAKRNLDCALRNAILGNDTRNQIDIYEKLAEIYTNLRDWEGVVHVLDKIDDCFEDLGHFCGVNIDERTTLRRRLWMTTRRAQCLKRLGRIAESKEQVRELKKIVKRREDLWTRKDRGNEEYRNILAMIENDIARGRASRGAGERSSESVIGAVYRYRDFERGRSSDSEANSNTPGEEGIIEVLGQILPNRQRDERSIEEQTGIIVAPESVQPSTMPHRGVEDNPRTSAILNDQSITPGPVPGSGAGNTTAAGTDANDGDNVEDADDLYFVLNPWMKPIMNWADTLGGTRAPPQYWKDQAPPGRLGGLFLWEARAFMADAFLRAIGVIETRVPD